MFNIIKLIKLTGKTPQQFFNVSDEATAIELIEIINGMEVLKNARLIINFSLLPISDEDKKWIARTLTEYGKCDEITSLRKEIFAIIASDCEECNKLANIKEAINKCREKIAQRRSGEARSNA